MPLATGQQKEQAALPALPRSAPWRLLAMVALTGAVGMAAWRVFGRVELLWITAAMAVLLGYFWLGHALMRRRGRVDRTARPTADPP